MWDFEQLIKYAQGFTERPSGTELAFVLSEWQSSGGLGLGAVYPKAEDDMPPTEALSPTSPEARKRWVKINNGAWQQESEIPSVTHQGLGSIDVLMEGIEGQNVIAPWVAKGVAAGYVIAPTVTLNQINADRTVGIALIRVNLKEDEPNHNLAPDEPFSAAQVTALSVWINEHNITNQEFADIFGVTAVNMSMWLQNNPRWRFAKQIYDRFV